MAGFRGVGDGAKGGDGGVGGRRRGNARARESVQSGERREGARGGVGDVLREDGV